MNKNSVKIFLIFFWFLQNLVKKKKKHEPSFTYAEVFERKRAVDGGC